MIFFSPLRFSYAKRAFLFALQHLFNFLDIGRRVKPGSYRLVSPPSSFSIKPICV